MRLCFLFGVRDDREPWTSMKLPGVWRGAGASRGCVRSEAMCLQGAEGSPRTARMRTKATPLSSEPPAGVPYGKGASECLYSVLMCGLVY